MWGGFFLVRKKRKKEGSIVLKKRIGKKETKAIPERTDRPKELKTRKETEAVMLRPRCLVMLRNRTHVNHMETTWLYNPNFQEQSSEVPPCKHLGRVSLLRVSWMDQIVPNCLAILADTQSAFPGGETILRREPGLIPSFFANGGGTTNPHTAHSPHV